MSSSTQGDSSALTRVHSAVEPRSISRPTRISPSRAASLRSIGIASSRLPSRMSVFVAMSAALATIFSLEKSRKWIIREGRSGISVSGAGAPMASGLRKSRGLRMVGDDIDSPVNVRRWYPLGMRRVLLAALVGSLAAPAAAQAHRVRVAAPAQFDVAVAQVRYAVPHGPRPALRRRARRADRPGLRGGRAPAPPAQARGRRPRGRRQPPPAAARRRPIWPRSCSARGRRAPCARPTVTQATNVLAAAPGSAPAACALGALSVERPALRPARRRAAARLRRALDHRPGPRRGLRAARSTRPSARPSRRRPPPAPSPKPTPCPPCPPPPPVPAEDRLPGPRTGGLPRRRRD